MERVLGGLLIFFAFTLGLEIGAWVEKVEEVAPKPDILYRYEPWPPIQVDVPGYIICSEE